MVEVLEAVCRFEVCLGVQYTPRGAEAVALVGVYVEKYRFRVALVVCEFNRRVCLVESRQHGVQVGVGVLPHDEYVVDEALPEARFDRFVFDEAILESRHE